MKQKMFLGITLFGIALAIYRYSAGQANFALITFAFLNTLFSAFLFLHRITKYSFLSFLDIYYIFSYVFFGLANMLTSSKGYLSLRTYIIANAIVFISNLSFALFSAFNIKKRTTLKMYKISSVSIMSFVFAGTILLLFAYVLLINRYGFAIYRSGYIGGLEIAAILGVSKYTGMLIDTSFRSLNLINIFLMTICEVKAKRNIKIAFLVVNCLLALLFYFNPFITYRWILAYFLIMLFNFYFTSKFNKMVLLTLLLFLIIFVAPFAGANFRLYGIYGLSNYNSFQGILENLSTGDFDAYNNLSLFIENEKEFEKYTTGAVQILGSIFSFIPRSVWKTKPLGSGTTLANFLRRKHTNISFPLIAEFYLAFGLFGVILFGFVLSRLSHLTAKLMISTDFFKKIFASSIISNLIFILRGDLMSSSSFTLGLLIPVIILMIFFENTNCTVRRTYA